MEKNDTVHHVVGQIKTSDYSMVHHQWTIRIKNSCSISDKLKEAIKDGFIEVNKTVETQLEQNSVEMKLQNKELVKIVILENENTSANKSWSYINSKHQQK